MNESKSLSPSPVLHAGRREVSTKRWSGVSGDKVRKRGLRASVGPIRMRLGAWIGSDKLGPSFLHGPDCWRDLAILAATSGRLAQWSSPRPLDHPWHSRISHSPKRYHRLPAGLTAQAKGVGGISHGLWPVQSCLSSCVSPCLPACAIVFWVFRRGGWDYTKSVLWPRCCPNDPFPPLFPPPTSPLPRFCGSITLVSPFVLRAAFQYGHDVFARHPEKPLSGEGQQSVRPRSSYRQTDKKHSDGRLDTDQETDRDRDRQAQLASPRLEKQNIRPSLGRFELAVEPAWLARTYLHRPRRKKGGRVWCGVVGVSMCVVCASVRVSRRYWGSIDVMY